jgi:hypothetical protein
LLRDLPAYVRGSVGRDEAFRRTVERVANRRQRFLTTIEAGVFDRPASPIARLLRWAGCERADLRELVRRQGLEGALAELAERGVYLTQAELKGRGDIVRGSLRIPAGSADFHNPLLRPHWFTLTSGSTGRPLLVGRDFDEEAEVGQAFLLAMCGYGFGDAAGVVWRATPQSVLGFIHSGTPVVGWFGPVEDVTPAVRAGRVALTLAARLSGASVSWPGAMPVNEPARMVAWLRKTLATNPRLVIVATSSAAARVSNAAVEAGLSLEGVLWRPGGEPITRTRFDAMGASGARVMPSYAAVEAARIGYGCADAEAIDDVHVSTDRLALIDHRRVDASSGLEIRPLLFTTLSPHASMLLINAELGDTGVLETRDCSCELGRLGMTAHVSHIRSFEKLTSEGMTIDGANILRFLEVELPSRFGGGIGDYQLVECELADGSPCIEIRASPTLGPIDEGTLRAAVLTAIGGGSAFGRHIRGVIDRSGTLAVRRTPPETTPTGKVRAFVPLQPRHGRAR